MSKEAMKLALEALDVLLTEPIAHKAADRAEYLLLQAAPAIRKALAEQPAQQEPVAWKLVPTEPTEEMLKAMDNCSKEGYDERLYAGHAASVYMAAVDAAPTPPAQRTWVGLAWGELPEDGHNHDFLRGAVWAEAKLKERNT